MAIIKGELKQATSETASDTLYPKTSADSVVYDNTQSGITATNVQSAIDEIGSAKEIFVCTYGTTTYAQITSALTTGKLPVCFYDNKEYVYVGLSTTNRYTFGSQLFDTYRYVSVNSSDSWGNGINNFEVTSNKVTSISNASTNAQYPSAKCVYDAIPQIQINGTSIVNSGIANILTETAYNASTNKIATMGDIPSLISLLESLDGYRDVGTQTLKNINGEFMWVTDT